MGIVGLFLFGEKDEIVLKKVATVYNYDYAKLHKVYMEVMGENVDYDNTHVKYDNKYYDEFVKELAKSHKVDVSMIENKFKEVLIRMDA